MSASGAQPIPMNQHNSMTDFLMYQLAMGKSQEITVTGIVTDRYIGRAGSDGIFGVINSHIEITNIGVAGSIGSRNGDLSRAGGEKRSRGGTGYDCNSGAIICRRGSEVDHRAALTGIIIDSNIGGTGDNRVGVVDHGNRGLTGVGRAFIVGYDKGYQSSSDGVGAAGRLDDGNRIAIGVIGAIIY